MTATRACFCSILAFKSENKATGIDSIVIIHGDFNIWLHRASYVSCFRAHLLTHFGTHACLRVILYLTDKVYGSRWCLCWFVCCIRSCYAPTCNLQSIFRWRIAPRLWESDHAPRTSLWLRQIERELFHFPNCGSVGLRFSNSCAEPGDRIA